MAMRCEEAGKKIQIRGPRFPSIPRGLSNVGTTCFVDFRVVTGQCQDNIMEMQEEDPGRDEIQITEPRKSVFLKKILQVFLMDIVSLMDFKVDSWTHGL